MVFAIVDDSSSDTETLVSFIDKYYTKSLLKPVIKKFTCGESFVETIAAKSVDVVFLDIFMDKLTGVDVARKIREINDKCLIVFVSASNDFATESYEVEATSYLVKPLAYNNFELAMKKLDDKIKITSCYFDLKQRDSFNRILLSKIVFVDYYNHYVQIHLTDGAMVKSYMVTFAEVSATLLQFQNFIFIYRNLLINMDKVALVEGQNFEMQTGDVLPIKRDIVRQTKQRYHEYVFGKLEGEK